MQVPVALHLSAFSSGTVASALLGVALVPSLSRLNTNTALGLSCAFSCELHRWDTRLPTYMLLKS